MPDPTPATVGDVERDHATCGDVARTYATVIELEQTYADTERNDTYADLTGETTDA
jgi:hypothetical protein